MMNTVSQNSMILSDGRILGYAEYGNPAGNPIMYFHTHPGSRINGRFLDEPANINNIRIITPERPGSGISDFKPDRIILDWPEDIVQLADHLQIDTFAVLGASGGGPYAAVCGYKLPERVTKVGLLAAVGPLNIKGLTAGMQFSNRFMFGVAKIFPKLVPYLLTSTARGVSGNLDKVIEQLKKSIPDVDIQAMDNGNHWDWFVEDLQEAFRSGVLGPGHDTVLYVRPWGFSLEEIKLPVFLWQGEEDLNVPLVMGQFMAGKIPNCQAKILPDLGHLSVIVDKAEEALLLLSK